jgi:DNA-binding NarL/FixJ family response regulator
VVRAGLESIVRSSPNHEVVGSVANPAALPAQIEALQPDVVLIDVERGDESPAPRLLSLGGAADTPAIVLLAAEPDGAVLAEALRLGARGVLPREASAEEILAAVEAAATGLVVLHPEGGQILLPLLSALTRRPPDTLTEPLTPREIEVLGMLAEGAGNKIIARRLGISEHTVKFHVGSILAKLNASSRTEAVTSGLRQGLIMV